MIWTHIYDVILKIGVLFLSIFLLNSIPFLVDKGILVVVLAITISAISYIFFLRTLGSFMYCRLYLKMKVSLKQASTLDEALCPNPFLATDLKWLPLKEVKYLNEEYKYEVAVNMLSDWKQEKYNQRQEKIIKSQSEPRSQKILGITAWILSIACIGTSFLELPPATFFIKIYCNVFNTDRYPPILIGVFMTVVCLIITVLIQKISKKK